ncbi:hypothetical protein [Pseudonocardia sp. MH-G8]|uniref:hypothetical protein n=1 Tax=Pseudonocardia sp. MH-G8 TaxID=1854588 RepID=UPI000BA01A54|nr:hypothetical protein [Pseudonocardia sp. MH-G8]OZM79802.1 hypothetical protein CFP66_24655 [Pseudonocardia sp. MH-G8]
MGLRLPIGDVTVLLGPALARLRVMAQLDEGTARTPGNAAVGVLRLVAGPDDPVADRLETLDAAGRGAATIVLVDRFTDGLAAHERAALLRRLHAVADGRAVLVNDRDPVAALAAADGALRVDRTGTLSYEPVGELDYLAS